MAISTPADPPTPAGPRLGAFAGADLPSMDALRGCVHCGICLPQCPTYRVLGEEMDSPRGRLYLIRAAAEGRIALTPTFAHHLDLCLGCRACETACPAGVPFGSLLEATRAQLVRQRHPSTRGALRRLVLRLLPAPRRLGRALALLRLYQASGARRIVRWSGILRAFPRLAAMESLVPAVPAAAPLPARVAARGTPRGRVGLLTGCVQRHLYPDVGRATARLLALAGWDVVIPPEQGCCGALELHAGQLDRYRARARALARVFAGVDHLVVDAAGCGAAMKEYGHWLGSDPAAAGLAARVRDVSELLVDAELPLGPLPLTVTYHDACHLAHGQRIRAEPRTLLGRIPGLRLVDLAEADLCCGSAGVYNLFEPDMAEALVERKVARIRETGARVVAAGNPGCLLQIARACRARGVAVETLHPVELLARSVDAAEGPPDARGR
jgi:glycolate oxidase iron-sulfur subunit